VSSHAAVTGRFAFTPAAVWLARKCCSDPERDTVAPWNPDPHPPQDRSWFRWMGVTDTNNAGFIHGGTVMKLCDEAAGLAAIRYSRCRVVTGGVDRVTFLEPVELGDLVTFRASVNAAWRTPMEVGVRVEAERPATGELRHTSSDYLTLVAVDEEGRPTPVPALRTSGSGGHAARAGGADAARQPARRTRRAPATRVNGPNGRRV
jgi:acyl-CoA hydrolase